MSREVRGLLWGLIGVASFSLTLPATRSAVPHLGVDFVVVGRAAGAAILAAAVLALTRQPIPRREDFAALLVIAGGVVIGFPLLTTFAMSHVSASHGSIVVGLLPLSTAVAAVLLAGERPSRAFWAVSLIGTGILLAFVLDRSGGRFVVADLALLGAVAAAAVGYAKGGQLAARLGGWQTICWALVVATPLVAVAAVLRVEWPTQAVPPSAWIGFAYVTLVSQFAGFFAWYHGLSLGGIARVSQTQLLQLFLTLFASSLLLDEAIDAEMLLYAVAIVGVVAVGSRLRVAKPAAAREPTDAT